MSRHPRIGLCVTAIAFWFLAAPARTQTGEPFRGSGASTTTNLNVGGCFDYAEYTLTGRGNVLGKFTGVGQQFVYYCWAPNIEGDVTFTAASGDQLSVHYIGTTLDFSTYVCEMTATWGTGQFQGAVLDATLLVHDYDLNNHPFDIIFYGTIQYP